MPTLIAAIFGAALLLTPLFADARGHASGADSSYRSHSSHRSTSHSRSSSGVRKSSSSKTKRDPAQRAAFQRSHPCPSTGKTYGACPGYVVDHIKALKSGGRDDPSNMQWQTVEAAKAKDKWE